MNQQNVHYYEAERLLRIAAEKTDILEKVARSDAYGRADLEQEIGNFVQQAHVHALLAGIVLSAEPTDSNSRQEGHQA